jgi:hypothetical protein
MPTETGEPSLAWEQGADTTTIRCRPHPQSREAWYVQLSAFITQLNVPELALVDRQLISGGNPDFVDGIEYVFRGRHFRLISDVPGELLVLHGKMRAQHVEELCHLLSGAWTSTG